MTRLLRAYSAILLALLLAFTAQSMAIARGMPNAAGEIILCTGTGIVSVAVDENGQPVDRPHICPDCAMSLFAMAVEQPLLPVRPLGRSERISHGADIHAVSAPRVPATARGPPDLS